MGNYMYTTNKFLEFTKNDDIKINKIPNDKDLLKCDFKHANLNYDAKIEDIYANILGHFDINSIETKRRMDLGKLKGKVTLHEDGCMIYNHYERGLKNDQQIIIFPLGIDTGSVVDGKLQGYCELITDDYYIFGLFKDSNIVCNVLIVTKNDFNQTYDYVNTSWLYIYKGQVDDNYHLHGNGILIDIKSKNPYIYTGIFENNVFVSGTKQHNNEKWVGSFENYKLVHGTYVSRNFTHNYEHSIIVKSTIKLRKKRLFYTKTLSQGDIVTIRDKCDNISITGPIHLPDDIGIIDDNVTSKYLEYGYIEGWGTIKYPDEMIFKGWIKNSGCYQGCVFLDDKLIMKGQFVASPYPMLKKGIHYEYTTYGIIMLNQNYQTLADIV